jgi:hypothetical protein
MIRFFLANRYEYYAKKRREKTHRNQQNDADTTHWHRDMPEKNVGERSNDERYPYRERVSFSKPLVKTYADAIMAKINKTPIKRSASALLTVTRSVLKRMVPACVCRDGA